MSVCYDLKSSHIWHALLLFWKYCGELVILNCILQSLGVGLGDRVTQEDRGYPPAPLFQLSFYCVKYWA